MNPIFKRSLLILSLLLPTLVDAQTGVFVLKGKIRNLNPPAKAYLCQSMGVTEIWDSTFITDGNFEFQGKISKPVVCFLFIAPGGGEKPERRKIYIEEGAITITGKGSLADAVIPHSQINDDFVHYLEMELPFIKMMDSITKVNNETITSDPAFGASIYDSYRKAKRMRIKLVQEYIGKNPDSYFSLMELNDLNQNKELDLNVAEQLYKGLTVRLRNSVAGQKLRASLARRYQLNIGSEAPVFVQNDIHDKPVSLNDFRGKYVLLDFWASWCAPCRAESPYLRKAYSDYKDKNFTILSVSLDREGSKDRWLKAITYDSTGAWTHVSDLQYFKNEVAQLYFIQSIPASFLIDPSGKIIAKDLRGADLSRMLETLFKK
jgi:peroxiredoxin